MAFERLTSLTRALVFFLVSLVLLIVVGTPLQLGFGLPGHSAMEFLVFAGLPIAFVVWVEKKPLKPFLRLRMLSAKGFGKSILLGAVCWFTAQLLGMAMSLLLNQLGGQLIQPYDFLFEAPVWLALVSGALVPAICEELSFRGYVQGALRPLGPTVAVVLTGLLFGIMHMSLVRLLPLTLLGILWALVVQRSGSILPGMIMHLLNNGIAVSLAFFAQSRTNPADTQASLEALNAVPALVLWIAIGIVGALGIGAAVAAYFLAASFNPSDLARPEDFQSDRPQTEPERPAFANPEDLPAEVRALEADLAGLRQRRQRMLQATAAIAGFLSLTIFLLIAYRELAMIFG